MAAAHTRDSVRVNNVLFAVYLIVVAAAAFHGKYLRRGAAPSALLGGGSR